MWRVSVLSQEALTLPEHPASLPYRKFMCLSNFAILKVLRIYGYGTPLWYFMYCQLSTTTGLFLRLTDYYVCIILTHTLCVMSLASAHSNLSSLFFINLYTKNLRNIFTHIIRKLNFRLGQMFRMLKAKLQSTLLFVICLFLCGVGKTIPRV